MSKEYTEKELDDIYDEGYKEGRKDAVNELSRLVEDVAWEVEQILEGLRKQIDKVK